eukprot:TRINITY_DN5897_c0_g1_i2.p2 TRINITY_DN5897_c0_g1~~TRINITY_DN5897_c0_g1_i2.p2  ORF type:complete len:417 (+),score=136.13 TRINITY_DN5897_c0_g1_i2:71-1321(+)
MSATVLVLGAGLVTPPLIVYLSDNGYKVIVANRTLESAEKLTKGIKNAEAKKLDVETAEGVALLEELVPKVDAVVSMLPYLFHPVAAKVAVKNKKHFFTTSYATDFMRSLDAEAKAAGIVVVNECGLDPGTDHMSAMKIIDDAHAKGGKITSFTSYCGGLPAPSDNDNPFGYKLSWAPRGVLLASRNDAHFLKDGKDVDIAGKDLFDNFLVEDTPIGKVECYPNRNSTQYLEIYGIPECQTIIRGTYRYPGWCQTIKKIADLGYLSIDPVQIEGKTFASITQELIKAENTDNLAQKVAEFLKIEPTNKIISNMEWMGLFSQQKVPQGVPTRLDALCSLCKEKLVYKPGERDMVLMRHQFTVDYSDRKEFISCTLVDYGIPNGDSSMSRTVSLPVGIAIKLVLTGPVSYTHLTLPTT